MSTTQNKQDEMINNMKLMMDSLSEHTKYLYIISEELKTLQTIFAPLQKTLESISDKIDLGKPSSLPETSSKIVKVTSSSEYDKEYTIDIDSGTCDCPDYQYRHADSKTFCKHLMKVIDNPTFYGLNKTQLTHLTK